MNWHLPSSRYRARQRGVTLLEALIAIVVLALGVLGLIGVQSRSVVESRTSNTRQSALRLIADLNERIAMNPTEGVNYISDNITSNPVSNCDTATGCTAAERRQHDLALWGTAVTNALGANAFTDVRLLAGNRQLQITLAWTPNEKNIKGQTASVPEGMQLSGTNIPEECKTMICHMQILELPFVSPLVAPVTTTP